MAVKEVHEFCPVIYPCRLWVAIGNGLMLDRFPRIDLMDAGNIGETEQTWDARNGKEGVLVRFRSRKDMTAESITHESVHAAAEILRYVGADIDVKNQEPFAYLAGFVADCIDQVKKNKFKE